MGRSGGGTAECCTSKLSSEVILKTFLIKTAKDFSGLWKFSFAFPAMKLGEGPCKRGGNAALEEKSYGGSSRCLLNLGLSCRSLYSPPTHRITPLTSHPHPRCDYTINPPQVPSALGNLVPTSCSLEPSALSTTRTGRAVQVNTSFIQRTLSHQVLSLYQQKECQA